MKNKHLFPENCNFRLLVDLHILGCPECDLTTFRKYLSVSLDINSVVTSFQKLMNGISQNFIFSCTLTVVEAE